MDTLVSETLNEIRAARQRNPATWRGRSRRIILDWDRDANQHASEFFPNSLHGPDAIPCTKRSDAAGREDLAMTQVPTVLELANADDPQDCRSEIPWFPESGAALGTSTKRRSGSGRNGAAEPRSRTLVEKNFVSSWIGSTSVRSLTREQIPVEPPTRPATTCVPLFLGRGNRTSSNRHLVSRNPGHNATWQADTI